MAVQHRCWRFSVAEAVERIRGITQLEDLFTPDVTALAERVRADPKRTEQLTLARLDATDDELWTEILLGRTSFENAREPPGAQRLMVLLIDGCDPAGGIRGSPFFVEEVLKAAGWDQSRREIALRGERLFTFFETQTPWLGPVAAECRNWLDGGWLDATTAAAIGEDLRSCAAELEARTAQVAAEWSEPGRTASEIEGWIRSGLADLRSMLSHAEPGTALWIIQD